MQDKHCFIGIAVILITFLFEVCLVGNGVNGSQLYAITELANGEIQYDLGNRYISRSGYDDRKWPKSTYEGIVSCMLSNSGQMQCLTSEFVIVTNASSIWQGCQRFK